MANTIAGLSLLHTAAQPVLRPRGTEAVAAGAASSHVPKPAVDSFDNGNSPARATRSQRHGWKRVLGGRSAAGDTRSVGENADAAELAHVRAPASGWLASLSKELDAKTNTRATVGNQVRVFIDGESALPEILAAIDAATTTICYETYNFLPHDPVAQQVAEHLMRARKRGVEVRVVVDAFGSRDILFVHNKTLAELRQHGVEVHEYNPIDNLNDLNPRRDHRKVVLVDGSTAFVGGMNTGVRFMGKRSTPGRRHDAFARIRGPAVAKVAQSFVKSWQKAGGSAFALATSTVAPQTQTSGTTVRIVEQGPSEAKSIRAAYLTLIEHATSEINIENSFPLADDIAQALVRAAKRGVRVRLIAGTGEGILGIAARRKFSALRKAGVEIFFYPTRVHTKAMSVDGQVCTIGSANFDNVALAHNREIICLIEDPSFTAEFNRQLFERDLVGSPDGAKTHLLSAKQSVWGRFATGVVGLLWPRSIQ